MRSGIGWVSGPGPKPAGPVFSFQGSVPHFWGWATVVANVSVSATAWYSFAERSFGVFIAGLVVGLGPYGAPVVPGGLG